MTDLRKPVGIQNGKLLPLLRVCENKLTGCDFQPLNEDSFYMYMILTWWYFNSMVAFDGAWWNYMYIIDL